MIASERKPIEEILGCLKGKKADHRMKTSVEIAVRLIRGLKPLCWGLYMMPLGHGHRVPVGLEAAGLQGQG